MIWVCIIAFGVFGLINHGVEVFWAVIAIGVVGLVMKLRKSPSEQQTDKTIKMEIEPEKKLLTMPKDAYESVSKFAQIANQVYNYHCRKGFSCDPHWTSIIIKLTYGDNGGKARAYYRMGFDSSIRVSLQVEGYELGEGLHYEDDYLVFESEQIDGMDQWLERPKGDSAFDNAMAQQMVGAIVATVVNNFEQVHCKDGGYSANSDGYFVYFGAE